MRRWLVHPAHPVAAVCAKGQADAAEAVIGFASGLGGRLGFLQWSTIGAAPVSGAARHLGQGPALLLGEDANDAASSRAHPLGAQAQGALLRLLLARLVDARKDPAVLLYHHPPAGGAGA